MANSPARLQVFIPLRDLRYVPIFGGAVTRGAVGYTVRKVRISLLFHSLGSRSTVWLLAGLLGGFPLFASSTSASEIDLKKLASASPIVEPSSTALTGVPIAPSRRSISASMQIYSPTSNCFPSEEVGLFSGLS